MSAPIDPSDQEGGMDMNNCSEAGQELYEFGDEENPWSAEEVADFMARVEDATGGSYGATGDDCNYYSFTLFDREIFVRVR